MGVYAAALFYSAAILYLACRIGPTIWRPQGTPVALSNGFPGDALVASVLAGLPVVLLLGFREAVGTDYRAYVEMFHLYQNGVGVFYREPGFWAINVFADWFAGEPWAMFLLAGLLSVIPLFWVMVRYSPAPWLSIVILFGLGVVYFQTNGVRSAIAIGILCLFYSAIWRAQVWRWAFGVGVSAVFHYTALLALAGYWVFRLHWPFYLLAGLLAASAAMATIPGLSAQLGGMLAPLVPVQYASYRQALVGSETKAISFGLVLYFLKGVVIVVCYGRTARMGTKVLALQNISFFGVLLFLALYQFDYIGRVALFFLPALALYWVYWIRLFKPRLKRVTMGAFLCIGYIVLFVRGGLAQHHDATPYMSIVF
jgi:hypothetical protein